MYKWIDHIVVRVKDIEEGLQDYEGKMGLKQQKSEGNSGTRHEACDLAAWRRRPVYRNLRTAWRGRNQQQKHGKVCTWWRLVLTTSRRPKPRCSRMAHG